MTSSTLIVIGVGAAYVYSAFAVIERGPHIYFDTATMVLMLFTLGRLLEAAGRARAARDLEPLLAAERETVVVVQDGMEICRTVREVEAGMVVRVRPSERIPVDGVVTEGEYPHRRGGDHGRKPLGHQRRRFCGDCRQHQSRRPAPDQKQWCRHRNALGGDLPISSRSANAAQPEPARCRPRGRRGSASRSRPRRDDGALLGAVVVYRSGDAHRTFGAGCCLPLRGGSRCTVGISLGIGRLARCGCLVRDPAALETLARTRLLAFDKTGTLTAGSARVVDIEGDGVGADELLGRAAGLERHSEHSLAQAITQAAAARGVEPIVTRNIQIVPGRGIRGIVDGQPVAAGNGTLMADLGWSLAPSLYEHGRSLEAGGYSVIYVGWGQQVRGVLSLDNSLLPEVHSTVNALRSRGLHLALLTGDLEGAAQRVAAAAGIDDVEAALSPEARSGPP